MPGGGEAHFWSKVRLCEHVRGPYGDHYLTCGRCCWPWQGACDTSGYGRTRFVLHFGQEVYVHRVAWAFAHGGSNPPRDLEVAHACDMRACCNPSHLWLATHQVNMADATRKGRMSHGTAHRLAAKQKLDFARAEQIRALASEGWSQQTIARQLGVSQPMISHVLTGKAWATETRRAGG
jgi:predicted XRE-type DNA-binding protein